jgi:hypothetical protein
VQSSSKDLRIARKLRRSRPSNSSKDKCREVVVEVRGKRRRLASRQRVSWRDTSSFSWIYKEERTDEIIRGDFAKFRGPLDLAEVQGGYGGSV